MVLFNYATKELTAKVVYYGPGLCGKTTNLQYIHEKLPIKNKGKMLSLATETDRTLFFDFLPIELGTIRGMKTRIQLYTVPGQVFYNATRRMVLKGADCVVFVADSQEPMLEPNLQSLENLRENLEANEIDPNQIPMVLQFNKRDLPNALPIEILNEKLNAKNHPFFEAVALKGIGVEDTLKGATALVFRSLSTRYGEGGAAGRLTAPATAPAPPPPAPPPPPVAAAPAPSPWPAPMAAPAPSARPVSAPAPIPRPAPSPAPAPASIGRSPIAASATIPPLPESEPLELDVDAESEPEVALAEEMLEDEAELDVLTESEPAAADPRETLVRGEAEAFALRQKLRNPPQESLDLQLEELTEESPLADEAPAEELTLDADVAEPEAEAEEEIPFIPEVEPEPPRAGKGPSPVWTKAPEPAPEPPPPTPPAARPMPPPPRPAPAPPRVVAPTVSIEITGDGRTDVAIPLQVRIGDDRPPVSVELLLTLNVRVK